MGLRGLLFFNAIFALLPITVFADAVVEGHVELPKSHFAPVMAKRYEIVTTGGVLSPQPRVAVVYLDGSFAKPPSPPTKQIAQKDLTFLPSHLPVHVCTRGEVAKLDDAEHSMFADA